ncbi:hypothetical protein BCR44DRAFT_1442542, partial [Catenaria anguillulae PL171]
MNDLETRLATARARLIANRRFFIPAFASTHHPTPIPNHVQFKLKCCFVDNSTRSVLPPHIFVPDSGTETSSSSTPTPAPAPHRKSHTTASPGVPNRQTPLHNANNYHTPSKPSKAVTHPPTADSPNPITQRVVKGRAKRSLQPAFANPDRTKLDNTLFTPSQTRATAAPSVAQSSAPSPSSGSNSPLPRAKRTQQRPKTATPPRSLSHGAVQSATPVFNAQLETADAAVLAQSSVGHSSPTSSVPVHLELHPPSSTSPNTDSTARRPRFSAQLKPSREAASILPRSPPNPAADADAVDATDAQSIPCTTVTTSLGPRPTVPLQVIERLVANTQLKPDFSSTSSTASRSPALAQPKVQPIDLAPSRSLASSPLSSQPARPDTIPLLPAAAQASANFRPPTHALIDTDSSDQSSKSNPDTIHASPESSSSPSSPTARASGQSSPPGASNDQSPHTSSTPSPSAAALARAIGKRKRVPMSQDEDASDEVESQRDLSKAPAALPVSEPFTAVPHTPQPPMSATSSARAPRPSFLATLSTTPASTIGPDAHKLMSHVAFATPTHVPSTASAGPPITPCPGPTTHASTPSFLTGISTTTTPSWLAGHVPGSTPAPATSTPSFLASTPRSLATTPSGTGVSAIAALLAKDVSELGGL